MYPTCSEEEGASAGVCDLTLTLTYRQTWAPDAPNVSASDKVNVNVIDVDLDIDGVMEEQEDDPGGFVGVNAARRKIRLAADPHTVAPVVLQIAEGRDKVQVFAEAAGGTPITDGEGKVE